MNFFFEFFYSPARRPDEIAAETGVFNLGITYDNDLNIRPSDAKEYTTRGMGNLYEKKNQKILKTKKFMN